MVSTGYALFSSYQVAISSSGPITVGIPGIVAKVILNKVWIFEVRDLWPEGAIQLGILKNKWLINWARRFERLCYNQANEVVALSPGQAEWIGERYNLNSIKIVPNASDNELFESLRDKEFALPDWALEKKLLLYTGTLGLIDDCRQILEAAVLCQKLNRNDVIFVLIGDGQEKDQLIKYSHQLKLDNTFFVGKISKVEVMQWLARGTASIFTVKNVPFLSTASPNNIFDAFAAGIPIIQVTDGWIKQLVDREQCGINVPIENASAMAKAIIEICDDQQLREGLSLNAKRVARDKFDRQKLALEMLSYIENAG